MTRTRGFHTMNHTNSTRATRGWLGRAISHLILIAGSVLMATPFVWMISTSLKRQSEVFAYPPRWIPDPIHWSNYSKALEAFPFWRYTLNTVYISVFITLGVMLTSSMAGYAFARMRFSGRDHLFLLILAVMMVPGQVTMIPVFLIVKSLGWMDSHLALIIPSLASPFGIFLLRQFYLTLPRDLEDAAYIDGCGPFRVYWQIFVPLSKPALATLGIFTFMGAWNSFLWPLILISSDRKKVLTVGLLTFQNMFTTRYNLLMAAALLATLPILIAYIFAQRYFIEGIALTGIKG